MRASRIFQARPESGIVALAQLCEERIEDDPAPDYTSGVTYIAPRLTPLPPQTPYTVGSSSMRPQVVPTPIPIKAPPTPSISPPSGSQPPSPPQPAPQRKPVEIPTSPPPPEHMVPTRSKWTSPPPSNASEADQRSFEARLGEGLVLALASTGARQPERVELGSASASEVLTDDGHYPSDVGDLDDVRSVRSFTEDSSPAARAQSQWSPHPPRSLPPNRAPLACSLAHGTPDERIGPPPPYAAPAHARPLRAQNGSLRVAIQSRGRRGAKAPEKGDSPFLSAVDVPDAEGWLAGHPRRSHSGPPRPQAGRYSLPTSPIVGPQYGSPHRGPAFAHPHVPPLHRSPSTVFYETGSERGAHTSPDASPRSGAYALPGSYLAIAPWQHATAHQAYPHHLMNPRLFSPAAAAVSAIAPGSEYPFARAGWGPRDVAAEAALRTGSTGPTTPTPANTGNGNARRRGGHAHSHSTATIVAPVQAERVPPASLPPRLRSRSGSQSASFSGTVPPTAIPSSPGLLLASPVLSHIHASSANSPQMLSPHQRSPQLHTQRTPPNPPSPQQHVGSPRLRNAAGRSPHAYSPYHSPQLSHHSPQMHQLSPQPNPQSPPTGARRDASSPRYSPGTDSPAPSSSGSSRYTSPPSTSPSSPTPDGAGGGLKGAVPAGLSQMGPNASGLRSAELESGGLLDADRHTPVAADFGGGMCEVTEQKR
jgi:terminal uridylyltransferase